MPVPVRPWTPPSWTIRQRLGEARHPGPPHAAALAGPASEPRRYLLHDDIQSDDIIRPGALLHYHRPSGWQSHLLLMYQSASRMWQWRDLSGKPPWHSAPKITPAHALAWWVAEHGLDLLPEDRIRLDANSAAM
eukprot:581705-Amphidinium_carterae.1